ncbi:sulfurtransferase TusA family protein [Phycicoccus sonneratiae]|uniref:Sulfurtransferase TusA family protein n=1 Tax=Phycicoccus sonneratiae TaxID=2807628 RepID=A0ABS2CRA8_9MICO|nr:sulfurtransferase TusA family protein [Phycicoccus sonneraticus]MBM6402427.1 sulfurtransferase TusA family protein [Phycicoccus sonneraticus]
MSAPPLVDARGTRCPVPVVRVARAARDLAPGAVVVLLADDVAARSDVPAWARMRGHAVDVEDEDGWTRYTVRVGGRSAARSAARST